MTRTKFFILSSIIIFALERVLSTMTPWPIFIFPVFVILFGLISDDDITNDLPYVMIAAVFFDFFSGFAFGTLIIAILTVFLTIYLTRLFLNIGGRSLVSTIILSLIFIFEYLFLLSFEMPKIFLSQALAILAESIILIIPIKFLLQRPSAVHRRPHIS